MSAADEQVIKLVLESEQRGETMQGMEAHAESLRARLGTLQAQALSGAISWDEFGKEAKKAGTDLSRTEELLSGLKDAIAENSAAQAVAAGTASDLAAATRKAATAAMDLKAAEAAMGSGAEVTATDLAMLKAKLEQAETQTKALSAALLSGRINEDQFQAGMARINATAAPLRAVAQGLGVATNNMKGLGQAGLQAGRVIQDFTQGGIGGILNNIEGLSMALGGGPGLAGILTVVGIGFFLLKDKIKAAAEEFGLFESAADAAGDHVEKLKVRIKELTEKKHLIPIETLELENANRQVTAIKAALEAVERMRTSQTEAEAKSGKAVGETFREAKDDKGNVIGAQGVREKLRTDLVNEMLASDSKLLEAQKEEAEIRARIARLEATPIRATDPMAAAAEGQALANRIAEQQTLLKKAQAAQTERQTFIPNEADIAIGGMVDTAEKGHGAEQKAAREQLGKRAKAAKLTTVAAGLEEASPETATTKEERKKAEEKLQKFRELMEDADKTAAEIETQMKAAAGMTVDQLDKLVHATTRATQLYKAHKAKVTAAASEVGKDQGDDVEARVGRDLLAGKSREDVTAAETPKVRAEIDKDDTVAPDIRGEVADTVVKKAVEKFSRTDLVKKAVQAVPAGMVEDLRKSVLDALAAGADPEAVRAKFTREFAAKVAQIKAIGAAFRDDAVKTIVEKAVGGVSDVDVATHKATAVTKDETERKKQEAKAEQDKKDLERGLGDDFLARAESRRAAIETDDMLTPNQKASERAKAEADLKREAERKFVDAGAEPGRAKELAGQAPAFVQGDIQQQLNRLRANQEQFNQANNLPADNAVDTQSLLRQLFAGLRTELAKRPEPRRVARGPVLKGKSTRTAAAAKKPTKVVKTAPAKPTPTAPSKPPTDRQVQAQAAIAQQKAADKKAADAAALARTATIEAQKAAADQRQRDAQQTAKADQFEQEARRKTAATAQWGEQAGREVTKWEADENAKAPDAARQERRKIAQQRQANPQAPIPAAPTVVNVPAGPVPLVKVAPQPAPVVNAAPPAPAAPINVPAPVQPTPVVKVAPAAPATVAVPPPVIPPPKVAVQPALPTPAVVAQAPAQAAPQVTIAPAPKPAPAAETPQPAANGKPAATAPVGVLRNPPAAAPQAENLNDVVAELMKQNAQLLAAMSKGQQATAANTAGLRQLAQRTGLISQTAGQLARDASRIGETFLNYGGPGS